MSENVPSMSLPPTSEMEVSAQHMRDGLYHFSESNPELALENFDAAIRIREAHPWWQDVQSSWLLAAAWINRSDVLRVLDAVRNRDEIIRSLDRAIDAMNFVPLDTNSAFADRMILAWINRGEAVGDAGDVGAALADFSMAEKFLLQYGEDGSVRRKFLGAMLKSNRARFLNEAHQSSEAWKDSLDAIRIFDGIEQQEEALVAGIKARATACRALALILDEPGGHEKVGDWIAVATDLIEDALDRARLSDLREPWVDDLVRFGAKIYRVCQPQFLGQFLTEWLAVGNDSGLIEEMQDELRLARLDLGKRVLISSEDTEFVESQTKILVTLQNAEIRLKELR